MSNLQIIISGNSFFYFLLSLTIAGIGVLWYYFQKEKKQKNNLKEKCETLERKINSMEVDSFKYKLNPHLFKNTLNSIQSHAYQTYFALDKLSNVLDFILYESDQQYVTVKEEVEFALNLIEINRLKISPLFDLRVKNKIHSENPLYEQNLIAPLITIDMIENAFKHADLQSPDAFISIVFELDSDNFILTVSNKISPKPAMKKEKGGFGKQSFKTRLAATYHANYKLEQFIEDDVYISYLKINLLEHKTQMHTA